MLASTVQFSKNNRAHQNRTPVRGRGPGPAVQRHPGEARFLRTQQRVQPATRPRPPFPLPLDTRSRGRYLPAHTSGELSSQCSTSMSSHLTDMRRHWWLPTWAFPHGEAALASLVLLRKEVIQPHLPVRLPCYDFVPIAGPTFDRSPHKGWATGFGCCRLS
jgi:hypothetical protein